MAALASSSFFYPLVFCGFHFEEEAAEWKIDTAMENSVWLGSGERQKQDLFLEPGRLGFCALATGEGHGLSVSVKDRKSTRLNSSHT